MRCGYNVKRLWTFRVIFIHKWEVCIWLLYTRIRIFLINILAVRLIKNGIEMCLTITIDLNPVMRLVVQDVVNHVIRHVPQVVVDLVKAENKC
jgi:hypothetical protein